MIIGICGLIGAGKDTIADYLVNYHGFRRESFAASLKDAVSTVFGWDRTMLEGRTTQSRQWREQVDIWWAQRLGMPDFTPRLALQIWGTDVARNHFHNDIWIASLENKLRTNQDHVVITDCRFPNEIDAIRSVGGQVIRVDRGATPDWYDCAMVTVTTPEDSQWIIQDQGQNMQCQYPQVHCSEWAWLATKFDAVIDNNGSIEHLYDQVKLLL